MAKEKRTLKTEVTAEIITDGAQQNVTELQRLLTALGESTAARKEELEGIKVQQDEIAAGAGAAEGAGDAPRGPGQGAGGSDGGIVNALAWGYASHALQTRIFGISSVAVAGLSAVAAVALMMPTANRFAAATAQWLDDKGGLAGAAGFLTGEAIDIGGNFIREGLEGVLGLGAEAGVVIGGLLLKALAQRPGAPPEGRHGTLAGIAEAGEFIRRGLRVGVFRDPEFDVALNKFAAVGSARIEDQATRLQNDIDAELGAMGFGAGVLEMLADYSRRTNDRIQDMKILEADNRLRSDAEYYAEPSGQEAD